MFFVLLVVKSKDSKKKSSEGGNKKRKRKKVKTGYEINVKVACVDEWNDTVGIRRENKNKS